MGVLAAALVALGAWVVVDRYTGPQADATAVFDDMTSAWSSYDEAALRSLYAPDAVVILPDGTTRTGLAAILEFLSTAKLNNLKLERVAPVTVGGDMSWMQVEIQGDMSASFVRLPSDSEYLSGTMLTVLQTKDGKILREWGFAPALTPPFDNAVTS